MGDHSRLKLVMRAKMSPPKTPTIISSDTEAGSWVAANCVHVKKAEATARTSRTPVLWTVPLSVMLLVVLMAPPYWALEMPPP